MSETHVNEIQDDTYQEAKIDSVEQEDGGYAVTYDGWTLWFQTETIEPKPGDVLRMYGRGIGYPVRGIAINGVVVRYQSARDWDAADRERIRLDRKRQRDQALADHDKNETRIAALPSVFQDRIKRFQQASETFEWQFQPYELFACEQAVVIAQALRTSDAIASWKKLDGNEQAARVPGLSDGHSGNTFDVACGLARLSLDRPELVERAHGAMCPVVGCRAYGCWAAENDKEESA